MSDDEFDNIPDEFAGIDDVDWNQILSNPQLPTTSSNAPVPQTQSPGASSSTHYLRDDEEWNSSFFEELDALERNMIGSDINRPRVPASSPGVSTHRPSVSHTRPYFLVPERLTELNSVPRDRSPHSNIRNESRFFLNTLASQPPSYPQSPKKVREVKNDGDLRHSLKRSRSASSPLKFHSPKKKGKARAQEKEHVWQVLSDFQDELLCPICSDLFVAAHLGNPCGHSFCGDCGWQWKMKGKNGCAICRTELSNTMPMIPNFALDNIIEKHVTALGQSGIEEWKPGGANYREWNARKEQWKKNAAERAKTGARKARRKIVEVTNIQDFIPLSLGRWIIPDDDEDDEDYVDGEVAERSNRPGRRRSNR